MKKSIKKKITNQKPNTPTYDSGRETRVLLEDMRDDIKLLAEQYGTFNQKFISIDQRFASIDRRFDGIDQKLVQHDKKFDRIEMAVLDNGQHIKLLKSGQSEINEKVDKIDLRLQKLEVIA